jgi:hypothetical protein
MIQHETKREECERRAAECVDLAQQATDPKARERFAAMAEAWVQLAKEMGPKG